MVLLILLVAGDTDHAYVIAVYVVPETFFKPVTAPDMALVLVGSVIGEFELAVTPGAANSLPAEMLTRARIKSKNFFMLMTFSL